MLTEVPSYPQAEKLATDLSLAVLAFLLSAGLAYAADPVCGDVNASGAVSATDALLVLKAGVGVDVYLSCPGSNGLAQTGQTTCSNISGEPQTCQGTRQDGELQLGAVHKFNDNSDGTITDELTGLMWEKLSDDSSTHDRNNWYTWATAASAKIATLNESKFAGYKDWRLPNRNELLSLTNIGAFGPAVFGEFDKGCVPGCTVLDCNCTLSDGYWTSSSFLGDSYRTGTAWIVDFYSGTAVDRFKGDLLYVRAVRGGQ